MTQDNHNPAEARRQVVQEELDARRTATERNRMGQFATPNILAVEIARYVQSIAGPSLRAIRFADPAVGTGSFFSAALTVFGAERVVQALGIEIDPAFCAAARDLWGREGLEVIPGDFTKVIGRGSTPSSPNLILANPPYTRHHHMGLKDKKRLKELVFHRTGVEINGLAGLYVYFLLLATDWMEDGGCAAWLVPSEFMDVKYGTALKRFLTERVTLLRIHRFDPDHVQFGDALVSSAVLVFRKAPPAADHAVEFSFGGTLGSPAVSDSVSLEQLRESRKWTIYPTHSKNDRRVLSDAGQTLGDYFRVQRGIATGSDKFFILLRADATRLHLPDRYLRPILPSPRYLKATIVEADEEGYPLIDRQLCVIDCHLPEDILECRHPSLWAYLKTAEALGIKDGYILRRRTPWYRQEQREPAPFLCTYMGRGSDEKRPFRFIWNRSRAIGTNLYLMLYPVGKLARMLREHPERTSEVFDMLGRVTGHELRGEGRVYGGGLNKIEPNELARISAVGFLRRWPKLRAGVERQAQLF